MNDALTLEYIATIEHGNRIREPELSRTAQIHRELTLATRADSTPDGNILASIGLMFSRIGRAFSGTRPLAGKA